MLHLPNLASQRHAPAVTRLGAAVLLALAGSASAATLSVGPGKTYAAPCAAIAAAQDGDIIEITGNTTYAGDVCGIYRNNLTIRGVNGRPKIDAAGRNAMGKGIWVVVGNNLTVDNVEMFGAKVPDRNGAAFRLEGTGFTLRNSFLHDNENGILTNANTNSDILIEYSEFGYNGHGDGYTHNIYIGHVKSLTFRYNYSHDANVGHNLKSRAQVNSILYNRFSSTRLGETGNTAAGQPSYEIDLPNAGTSYVIGNVIQQPSMNQNPGLLSYGAEGATNPGKDLYVVNNTFINDDASRGTFVMVGSGVTVPVLLQNNIFSGTGNMTNQATAIDKTNFRNVAVGFVNRAQYDLRPTVNALVIDAGSVPGTSAGGVPLAPVAQYRHAASAEARPVAGTLDIGAYEVTGTPVATPAPTPVTPLEPTGDWTLCASEGGTCTFTGTRQVRYGANGVYSTKTFTGSALCTNGVFGDPIGGVVKTCSFAKDTVTTTTTPAPAPVPTAPATVSWTACASEGGTCSFSGTREVRYGARDLFVTKTFTGSVACTNAVFGDPIGGVVKACAVSSVAQ